MNAPAQQKKQVGHRGWLCVNAGIENVVKCQPSPYAKAKLAQYPSPLIWPVYGDLNGAVALVEAVMTRDAQALRKLQNMHPDYDFGLGEWGKQLFADVVAESAKTRRTLKQRVYPNARRLAVELVTDTDTGHRQIVASFYRGRTRVTEQVLKEDQKKPQDKSHV